jgi:hypothetical protein
MCRYNPLEENGVKAVVETVKYDLPLKALKLGWCKIGSKAGAEHVAQLIAFNETLEARSCLSTHCISLITYDCFCHMRVHPACICAS